MRTVTDHPPHWQDDEVLRLFALHGTRRFWSDDIWDNDWESCRQDALRRRISGIPQSPIRPPPATIRWMLRGLDLAYNTQRNLRSPRRNHPKGLASAAPTPTPAIAGSVMQ
jgi:hypothetical protein